MNKIIVLNHKMNLTYNKLDEYIENINKVKTNNNIIICPSSLYLDPFKSKCKFSIGSQNVSNESSGAFTGEVSSLQLKSMGIEYSLVGHSERRNIFNETDELINEKVMKCLENDITPIICVGESLEEKEKDETLIKINNQISHAILGINETNIKELIIAYEPIWAIGSGITPTIEEIKKISDYIYSIIKEAYKLKPIVLYGGSVNKTNIKEILKIDTIDGVLIGTISSKIEEIKEIIEISN